MSTDEAGPPPIDFALGLLLLVTANLDADRTPNFCATLSLLSRSIRKLTGSVIGVPIDRFDTKVHMVTIRIQDMI